MKIAWRYQRQPVVQVRAYDVQYTFRWSNYVFFLLYTFRWSYDCVFFCHYCPSFRAFANLVFRLLLQMRDDTCILIQLSYTNVCILHSNIIWGATAHVSCVNVHKSNYSVSTMLISFMSKICLISKIELRCSLKYVQ